MMNIKYTIHAVQKISALDHSPYLTGVLMANDIEVIRFYENIFEGGFYPNGQPYNSALYELFLESSGRKIDSYSDELKAFDSLVLTLVRTDKSVITSEIETAA